MPLLVLSHLLLTLLLEVLLLSLGVQGLEFEVALQLLGLLTLEISLFSFLVFAGFLELADGVFTSGADLAQDIGPEMCALYENVGDADEVLEDWQAAGVIAGGGGSDRKIDALLWGGVLESEKCSVSRVHFYEQDQIAYVNGWSIGWSVMIKWFNNSPASSTALMSSGVSRKSVISALSLITVAHAGSFALSLVVVIETSYLDSRSPFIVSLFTIAQTKPS